MLDFFGDVKKAAKKTKKIAGKAVDLGASAARDTGGAIAATNRQLNKAGDAVGNIAFGNTKKAANTVVEGGREVNDLATVIKASLMGSDQDYQNTLDTVNHRMDARLNKGQTVFKDANQTQNISPVDLTKKIVGSGVGVASEIVPGGKGVGAGLKGVEETSKVVKAAKVAKRAATNAGVAASGEAGSELANDGKVSAKDAAFAALTGVATGEAGHAAGKGLKTAADKVKPVHAHYEATVDAPVKPSTAPAEAAPQIDETNDSVLQQAKAALAPEPPKKKTTTQLLDEQISGDKGVHSTFTKALEDTGEVKHQGFKAPGLEGAKDPASVAGTYLGKHGTDIVYALQQGDKTRSNLKEIVTPYIDNAEKAFNKAAKTKIGKADLERRIDSALNDRANAHTYFGNEKELEAYNAAQRAYDAHAKIIKASGKGTIENYSPRVTKKGIDDLNNDLNYRVQSAFSEKTDAPFLQERTKDEVPQEELDARPISMLRGYSNAVIKDLSFGKHVDTMKEALKNVDPVYRSNSSNVKRGTDYLQKLAKDTLEPTVPTDGKGFGKVFGEKMQNKAIAQTYKSALRLSPKYIVQNLTQRYVTRTQVDSKATRQLLRKVDINDFKDLEKGLTSGANPVLGEMNDGKVGNGIIDRIDPAGKVEQGNVLNAFRHGAAQAILDSEPYRAAIKAGMKPKQAVKAALQDKSTKDLVTRAGNVVVNMTQFGGNLAAKPAVLRESGYIGPLPLSKKWIQQYQRFPLGMAQLIGSSVKAKDARALDILRRGDPRQTKIVDYRNAVKALQAGLSDVQKAAKRGEARDDNGRVLNPKDVKKYAKELDKLVKVYDTEIKGMSKISGKKTAANIGKMWLASSAIQFLFDGATGGASGDNSTGSRVTKAVRYGAPVNVPTKEQNNPFITVAPAAPFSVGKGGVQFRKEKLLNFVPVVGPAYNRGRDIKRFADALTGGGSEKTNSQTVSNQANW